MKKKAAVVFAVLLLIGAVLVWRDFSKTPETPVVGLVYSNYDTTGFSFYYQRYLDLENGKVWVLDEPSGVPEVNAGDLRETDPQTKGFSPLCELSEAQIGRIQKACGRAMIDTWAEKMYSGIAKTEGRWNLSVLYADGTLRKFWGESGTYPGGFVTFSEGVYKALGYEIFCRRIETGQE